jgi:hypothetical protein
MLKVYLDESGIHDGAPVCVVAGYGNSVARWKAFERLWMRRIDRAKVKEFKATEFFDRNADGSGRGVYRNWSANDLLTFFNDLVAIINRTRPKLIGSVLSVNDFKALPREERQYLTGGGWHSLEKRFVTDGAPKRWFHVAMLNALFVAHDQARKHLDTAHFVCDQQKQYAPYVLQRFAEVKRRRPELRLGNLVYGVSHEIGALQAADLACYLCAQFGKERLEGRAKPNYYFRQLINQYSRVDLLQTPDLKKLLNGLNATNE